jgi:hypothetical protein
MNVYLHRAIEELKRADHLIYVSLKYTRSVDVIKSCIARLMAGYEAIIEGLLQKAKDKGKIKHIPASPSIRCDMVCDLYPDYEEFQDYITFYLLLRKMYNGKYTRAKEFRRNVAMTVQVDKQLMEVNIDVVTEYYKRSLKFIDYIKEHFGDAKKA